MSIAKSLENLRSRFKATDRMPAVFLGHGNPMNAIEDNPYSRDWAALGRALPRPHAILVVSAHWATHGSTLVDVSQIPRTIHDFGGFPQALFDQQYPATGHPELAREVVSLLASHHAEEDERWGLDHGAWAVLKSLYPDADVPVFQLSIDMASDLGDHIEIGKSLSELRNRGVLILGSGNIVHNLSQLHPSGHKADWAEAFDTLVAQKLVDRDFRALSDRDGLGSLLRQAHPSVDHYIPVLTIAGTSHAGDNLSFMNEDFDLGTISMRSFVFHS